MRLKPYAKLANRECQSRLQFVQWVRPGKTRHNYCSFDRTERPPHGALHFVKHGCTHIPGEAGLATFGAVEIRCPPFRVQQFTLPRQAVFAVTGLSVRESRQQVLLSESLLDRLMSTTIENWPASTGASRHTPRHPKNRVLHIYIAASPKISISINSQPSDPSADSQESWAQD